MGWRKKIRRARKLHRPSLKDWKVDGLYETFPRFVKSVLQSNKYKCMATNDNRSVQTLPVYLKAKNTSQECFAEDYEAKGIPVVISDIPLGHDGHNQEEWHGVRDWKLDRLRTDPDLRNRYFKCGEDDDGKSVKVKLKHFLRYMEANKDDSPLYIFDSSFDDDRKAKKLLADYRVPSYFQDDLFRFISESRRPPYRWFLVGPERSGTTVHIDPLATSAWNTLIVGKKRWVLFPPHVPKKVVKAKHLIRHDEDDEAIHYFTTVLPRIKREANAFGNHGDYRDFECYEFTQHAGETVFIPNGWWHAVLNLTHTVGVTQNFCSPRNFNQVWIKTRTGRKRMAYKWLCQLDEHYPHLAARARAMNKRDGFVMKYDPEQIKLREKEKRRKEENNKKRILSYQRGDYVYEAETPRIRNNSSGHVDREAKRSRLDKRHMSPLVSP